MADIKPADVKKLRDKTGAGMMDCKKALIEAGGEYAKAEKLLKEMGLAAAEKRSGRATNEGRIFTKVEKDGAVIIELACETDFVARNENFIKIGQELCSEILDKKLDQVTPELDEKIKGVISTIKENISLKRFTRLELGADECAADYIHGEGGIGVLVHFKADNPALFEKAEVKEFVFDCALHIAAFNPLYLSKETVDPAYLKEQEEIFTKQTEGMDKPEKVLQGIIKGKLNKHLSQICFMDQGFVKDDKVSVAKKLKELGSSVGGKLDIVNFTYYKLGDDSE